MDHYHCEAYQPEDDDDIVDNGEEEGGLAISSVKALICIKFFVSIGGFTKHGHLTLPTDYEQSSTTTSLSWPVVISGKLSELHDEFNGDKELKVGMQVHSDDEVYNLCNTYALRKGFSIRKGHIRIDKSNNIQQRDFLCSKARFLMDQEVCQDKKIIRLDTRTGCQAVVRFTVEHGVWSINFDHNHEMVKPEQRQFLRLSQQVSKSFGTVMSSMFDDGIGATKSYFVLANEAGGAENVGFTKKDAINYLQRRNDEMMEAWDAQGLLNHFKRKQGEDPNFFIQFKWINITE
ncbi:hypothetical protein Ddye_024882 [Dipteronia dyeriana]|uniref:FAR1 domain-containing protein n=1 Tax=Dipteronia dyeriana TaxID=168575 RepID=A0AAD9TVP9_9ROSI|nr:hypothetical protein Ddye_024882 [Dipteronia dyeriana]